MRALKSGRSRGDPTHESTVIAVSSLVFLALAAAVALAAVAAHVEVDEEQEQRGVEARGHDERVVARAAGATAGEGLRVDAPEADGHGEGDHELQDLQLREVLLPPEALAQLGNGAGEVEVVHEHVHHGVEQDPARRQPQVAARPGPGREGHDAMVVHVEEAQVLPVQHEEEGIEVLPVLGQLVPVEHAPQPLAQVVRSSGSLLAALRARAGHRR